MSMDYSNQLGERIHMSLGEFDLFLKISMAIHDMSMPNTLYDDAFTKTVVWRELECLS
jgi:hypothetical protein